LQKVYVLDSSVLLHDPNAILHFQENEVIIPYVVLEEVESKKRGLENVGRAAREAIRHLDRLREKGQLSQGVLLPNGGKVRIELNHYSNDILPLKSDMALADNRILAVTLSLTREEERPVVLVTKDIAMRVKADALGILTEDYHNDKVVLPPLMKEIVTRSLDDDEVSVLYKNRYIPLQSPISPGASLGTVPGLAFCALTRILCA